MYNRIIHTFIFFCALQFSALSHAEVQDAQKLVIDNTERVQALLLPRVDEFRDNTDGLYALASETIVPLFDFNLISRLVLGKYWRKASDHQRLEFSKQFQVMLIRTYAMTMLDFADSSVEFTPLRAAPTAERVTVRAEIRQSGAPPIPISYRLLFTDESWRIFDVRVDGISLVTNFRRNFSSIVRKHGLPHLIAQLSERNSPSTK